MATIIEIEEEFPIRISNKSFVGQPEFIVLSSQNFGQRIWLDVGEARELVKGLKKHIKKAEGN